MPPSTASSSSGPSWRRALGIALLGKDRIELEKPTKSDVPGFMDELGGAAHIAAHVQEMRDTDQRWPHDVPPDVPTGVGPAQFQAMVAQAIERVWRAQQASAPVITQRALSADEIRLLRDVPPHHGV